MGYLASLLASLLGPAAPAAVLSLAGLGAAVLAYAAYRAAAFARVYAGPLAEASVPVPWARGGAVGLQTGDAALTRVLAPALARFLHAGGGGRAAWALVVGADAGAGVGPALCRELAARGFNVVLYGADGRALRAARARLARAHPDARFRAVVERRAPAPAPDPGFALRVAASLHSLNLTLLVLVDLRADGAKGGRSAPEMLDALRASVAAQAVRVAAAVLPLLRRSRPSLVVAVGPAAPRPGPAARAADLALALARDHGVEAAAHRLGDVAPGEDAASWLRPAPRDAARAVLARVGCGRDVVLPYWPHALLHAARQALVPWALLAQRVAGAKGGGGGWGGKVWGEDAVMA
ncbi:hypothetical protein GGS23DRAFT_599734 [Durotheca rogersii]|uniref:uncharacterized protein n=1 Tax=Durotheca rogersii TaxID=419775 RepID=UPI00221FD382|nr:uncharacterized protein GGS23DRAFT_599734 [Durotheca rogersii]KAI5860074.1 hypothetical protein GGS23DRAFT_599734 [Durotheca rogersii]